MRHSQRLNVPIRLERTLPEPLQVQLAAQLRGAIVAGQLAARTRMPSTRTLAGALGISRGVALAAYERLLAEGYISGRHGSGTYVSGPDLPSSDLPSSGLPGPGLPSPDPPDLGLPDPGISEGGASRVATAPVREAGAGPGQALIDLRSERPSPHAFPLTAWRAAWRRAGHHAVPFGGLPPAGLPALRAAIAAHLRDTRGLALDGHEVIVTADLAEALKLLLRAQGGTDPVIALEDPAPRPLRAALERLGTVLPLPVDGSGARTDLIPAACDVVAVLPERGVLGTRLPIERRRALAAWARDSGGMVLEPAFDGLFTVAPGPRPGVLAVGDSWSTAMAGSFRDVLTPTLRLAFAVVPQRLAGEIEQAMSAGHGRPSITCQLAVTDLLTSGCVTHRVQRLSALYEPKRSLVRHALGAYPDTRLLGARTGSSATLLLPASVPAESVAAGLRARLVQASELAELHHPDAVSPGNGIVLSYGHLDEVPLCRALHALTRTLDEHRLTRRTAA
ncbi:PLP-dependent aminotransferase family protein [Nonomuraea sp. NPDC050404]|uniref:aminotransferase-like domain-containing protein n=1 Tax=Nonomuraea sp. NPDC050404 TaxID=3155783 RepID=UPI0033C7AAD2